MINWTGLISVGNFQDFTPLHWGGWRMVSCMDDWYGMGGSSQALDGRPWDGRGLRVDITRLTYWGSFGVKKGLLGRLTLEEVRHRLVDS